MESKFLCVMAGYDDKTERYLSGLQNELYNADYIGEHTKDLPQHITLGMFDVAREDEVKNLLNSVAESTYSFVLLVRRNCC